MGSVESGDLSSISPSKSLSLCLPTHQGRREYLRQLMQSIIFGLSPTQYGQIEICVCDNGSNDGTEQMVAQFRQEHRDLTIKYFRFSQNQGLASFEKVYQMAVGDYCWMIGSDDILPPDGITRVLSLIGEHHGVPGITVNKLNFNSDYTRALGSDNEMVMPSDAKASRLIEGYDSIISELIFLFCFISAHIVKRSCWIDAISEIGRERYFAGRHFAYSHVLTHIVRMRPEWFWASEYLVTQRLDNVALAQELGGYEFALQVTEDILDYLKFGVTSSNASSATKRKLYMYPFLVYWNPFEIAKYKAENPWSCSVWAGMIRFCVYRFNGLPLFWLTSFPALLIPNFLVVPLRAVNAADLIRTRPGDVVGPRRIAVSLVHCVLHILGLQKRQSEENRASLCDSSNAVIDMMRKIDPSHNRRWL